MWGNETIEVARSEKAASKKPIYFEMGGAWNWGRRDARKNNGSVGKAERLGRGRGTPPMRKRKKPAPSRGP